MKHDRSILTWAYAIELLLVCVVYALMLRVVGACKLVNVLDKHWLAFMGIGSALLAVGIALCIWFWQVLESEFGKYLKWRQADEHYLRGYKVQVILFMFTAGLPVFMAFGRNVWIAHAAWLAIVYGCVNGLTAFCNTVEIVRLRQKFQSDFDAVAEEINHDASDNSETSGKRPQHRTV